MRSDAKVQYLSERRCYGVLHEAGREATAHVATPRAGVVWRRAKTARVSLNPLRMLWLVGRLWGKRGVVERWFAMQGTLCRSRRESLNLGGGWRLVVASRVGKSLRFSICFLGMKDKVWQRGVKREGRQQLTCRLCLLKYHLTRKDEFLILTACFDHIFVDAEDLHSLPKFEPR